MLTSTKKILTKALRGGYAVGAFNVNDLEMLQAIIAGAEKEKAPVIVQTSEGAIAGMEDRVSVKEREAHSTNPRQTAEFVKKTGCRTALIIPSGKLKDFCDVNMRTGCFLLGVEEV